MAQIYSVTQEWKERGEKHSERPNGSINSFRLLSGPSRVTRLSAGSTKHFNFVRKCINLTDLSSTLKNLMNLDSIFRHSASANCRKQCLWSGVKAACDRPPSLSLPLPGLAKRDKLAFCKPMTASNQPLPLS